MEGREGEHEISLCVNLYSFYYGPIVWLYYCSKGAAVGAAGGAGLGAIIGHQSGETGTGALIGAGAGALVGALAGDAIENKESVIKFCPKCGKRFEDTQMTYCPYDGTELQVVEE